MKKHPEVFALLFLALVWSIGSQVIPARAEINRVMVLNGPEFAVSETLADCPVEKLRTFRTHVRERVRSDVRDHVRHEVRSTVHDLRDALRSMQ
jgi:hypothetical protein